MSDQRARQARRSRKKRAERLGERAAEYGLEWIAGEPTIIGNHRTARLDHGNVHAEAIDIGLFSCWTLWTGGSDDFLRVDTSPEPTPPSCPECSAIMVLKGTSRQCINCGAVAEVTEYEVETEELDNETREYVGGDWTGSSGKAQSFEIAKSHALAAMIELLDERAKQAIDALERMVD